MFNFNCLNDNWIGNNNSAAFATYLMTKPGAELTSRAGRFPEFLYPSRIPFFSFLGRHALLIYVVHQPVIYGVSLLVTALMGGMGG